MSKFTPGPWFVQVSGGDKETISAEKPGLLVDVYGLTYEMRGANARLIAAAPEMYALLQRYLQSAATPHKVDLAEVDQAARALLARIEGEK